MPLAIHQHWEQQIWKDGEPTLAGRLVRVPFPMPYGQNQEDFQPVNFPMEIEGKRNRVIKQRYFNDHLEVIVVPDELHTKLDGQIKLWIYSLSSGQDDGNAPPLQKLLLKSFVKDFIPNSLGHSSPVGFGGSLTKHFPPFFINIPAGMADIVLPPPRPVSLS